MADGVPEGGYVLPFVEEHRVWGAQRGVRIRIDDGRLLFAIQAYRALGSSGGRRGFPNGLGAVDGHRCNAVEQLVELAVNDARGVWTVGGGTRRCSHRDRLIWGQAVLLDISVWQSVLVVWKL